MKTLTSRISTFFGIILFAAIMVFIFAACPDTDDPGSNTPSIPSALQGTTWESASGDTITFTEKGVIINGKTFTLKDSQTSLDGTILFFNNDKTIDQITYQNGTIIMVNLGGVNKANDWSKNKSNNNSYIPTRNEIPTPMQNTSWKNQYGDTVSFSKTTVTIQLASGFNRTYPLFDNKLLYDYMLKNFPTLIDTYLWRDGFAKIYILFNRSEAAEVGYDDGIGGDGWPPEEIYDGLTYCSITYALNHYDIDDFTLLYVPMWHLFSYGSFENWEKVKP